MLSLSVMRTQSTAIKTHVVRPKRAIAVILWMLVLSPLTVGSLIVLLNPFSDNLLAPLLFYTAMPPLTAVPALALLFGIDAGLAIIVLMAGSLLTPFVLPPMMLIVLGVEVDISATELFLRLAVLVFGSFLTGIFLRHKIGQERLNHHRPLHDGAIVMIMMLIVIAVFDGTHGTLIANPRLAIMLTVMALAAATFYQILSAFMFLPFGLKTALTAGMLSGNRNLALVLAVLGSSATTEIALFVALGQVPVYLLPMVQRPLAKRFGFVHY
jgi:BASS family bile acid:Na+ symporter